MVPPLALFWCRCCPEIPTAIAQIRGNYSSDDKRGTTVSTNNSFKQQITPNGLFFNVAMAMLTFFFFSESVRVGSALKG